MKKAGIVLLGFLMFAVARAQEPQRKLGRERILEDYPQTGTHVGLKAVATFVSVSGMPYEQYAKKVSATFGYGYGISVNYYLSHFVGIHLEGIYSELEQKYYTRYDESRKLTLSYIEFPLMASLNTNYGRRLSLSVMAGPQLGVLAGSRFDAGNSKDYTSVDAVVALKTVDVGIAYGAGLNVTIGKSRGTHLNFGMRGVNRNTNSAGAYLGLMFRL